MAEKRDKARRKSGFLALTAMGKTAQFQRHSRDDSTLPNYNGPLKG
jgi:hypothetical protein